MSIIPMPTKKGATDFERKQREFHHELRKLREIKKFGPLLDKKAMQFALTRFQGRAAYIKANRINQLDIWDLETTSLLYAFEAAHSDRIYPIVTTSNHKYLLSGSADRSIAVWDLEKKVLLQRFEAAHTDTVTSLVVSEAEKMLIASVSLDKSIAIWHPSKRELVHRFEKAHLGPIYALAMTQDEEFIISSDEDTIVVWNIPNKKIHHRFLDAHCGSIYCLAVTLDNECLASGSADGTIRLWNLKENTLVEEIESEDSAEIWSITFSSIGPNRLIFGSDDGSVSTWEINEHHNHTTKKISHKLSKAPICSVFSSSLRKGSNAVSIDLEDKITVWDLLNIDKPIKQQTPHHLKDYKGIQLTSDFKYLIFIQFKYLYVWDFNQRKLVHIESIKDEARMWTMALSHDDQTVLVCFTDHTIGCFDLTSFRFTDRIPVSHQAETSFQPRILSTDRKIVYTDVNEDYITIFDSATRKEIHKFQEKVVNASAVSRDFRYLATGNNDFNITIWDLVEMKEHKRYIDTSPKAPNMKVLFTPDNKYLVSVNSQLSDGLKIWDYHDTAKDTAFMFIRVPDLSYFAFILTDTYIIWTGRQDLRRKYHNYKKYLSGEQKYDGETISGKSFGNLKIYTIGNYLAVSNDGNYLIGETKIGMEVWDLTSFTVCFQINLIEPYFAGERFVLSPDSKTMTCITKTNDIEIWGIEEGTLRFRFKQNAHHLPIVHLAQSKSNKYLISGCSQGTLALWNVHKRALESTKVEAHSDLIQQLIITDDDTKIISLSESEFRIRDLSNWTILKEFICSNYNQRFHAAIYDDYSKHVIFSEGKDIRFCHIESFEVFGIQDASNTKIISIVLTPDRNKIITGFEDGSIALWDPISRRLFHKFESIHKSNITSLVCDSKGKYLFTSSNDDAIEVIDLEKMTFKYKEKTLHSKSIKFMTLTPDGNQLACLSDNGCIGYLKLNQISMIELVAKYDSITIGSLALTKDNQFLILGKSNGTILLYDLLTRDLIWKQEKAHATAWILNVELTEDPTYFVTSGRDGTVAVWNIEKKILHHRFILGTIRVNSLKIIPNTNIAVAGTASNSINLLDCVENKILKPPSGIKLEAHRIFVHNVAVTRDGKYIASVGDDSKVAIWKRSEDNELAEYRKFEYPDAPFVYYVAITPDSKRIIASNNKTIQLWRFHQNVDDPPEELTISKKNIHPDFFYLTEDGRYFTATSRLDNSIYIWNLHQKNCFFHFKDTAFSDIGHVRFSSDFRYMYCILSAEIGIMKTSFSTNDQELRIDKIPTLYAIECLLNSSKYTKKELSEASRALSHYYYLPKGWDFLYFVAFMLPNVDMSLVDAAKENEAAISFDIDEKTPIDYLLEFEGYKDLHLQKFFAYFFKNISSLMNLQVLDAEKMLGTLSRCISKIDKTQTELSLLSYLACFSLKPEGIYFNYQKLPLQGQIIGGRFIQLKELRYKKKEVGKVVKDKGQETLFYHLIALPLSHQIYSSDSLKFIQMMSERDNISFFDAPIVRQIIDFYWMKSKKYLWGWLVFHLVPVALFTAFAVIRSEESGTASALLVVVVTFVGLLLMLEILQILSNLKFYLQDPYNFIESFSIIIQLITAGLFWSDVSEDALSFFVSLSTLLWYTKLLSLLRIIDQLRKFVRMIFEIIRDGISFAAVIFTYIAAFSILMYQSRKSDDTNDEVSFGSVVLEIYTFAIGSYDSSNYSGVTMPFFVLGTIFMPVILLNMLIALMGDTYGRASESAIAIDAKERISMISEISSTIIQLRKVFLDLFLRKGSKIPKQYLLVVQTYETFEDNTIPLETKLNLWTEQIKSEIRSEIRTEIRSEIRSEIRAEFEQFKQELRREKNELK